MAQLYFRYSTMNAGKSTEILKIAHNYEEQNKRVLLFTPAIDDRFGRGQITSRMGLQREAQIIDAGTDILRLAREVHPDCVLIDEGQFLTREQVIVLTRIVDQLNIPVIVYGLKTITATISSAAAKRFCS
jgi:thymidine kinase